MADCDTGSDIPAKGDTVAHLGARIKWKGIDNKDVTDESNIDAQNAIVFSSTDVFSPSVTLYHGIDSYSYLNKEYVEYGVDKTNNKAFSMYTVMRILGTVMVTALLSSPKVKAWN